MDFFHSEWFKNVLEILSVIVMFAVGKFATAVAQKLRSRLKFSIRKTREVRLHLAETRAAMSAERAMILQFHNGKKFVGEGRFHSYFLSCTFESIEMGFSAEMENLQNVPISVWADLLLHMTEKPEQQVFVVGHDPKLCDYTWDELKMGTYPTRWNIGTAMVSVIRSKKDQERGLIIFGWEHDTPTLEIMSIISEQENRLRVFLEDVRQQL